MTYTFVIILTRIGERLDLIARINPIMPIGNTYPNKKQNLGFGNQAQCLKKELCLQNRYKLVSIVSDDLKPEGILLPCFSSSISGLLK